MSQALARYAAVVVGVVVVGGLLRLPSAPVALAGALLCFGLRLVALRRGWELPVPRADERESLDTNT